MDENTEMILRVQAWVLITCMSPMAQCLSLTTFPTLIGAMPKHSSIGQRVDKVVPFIAKHCIVISICSRLEGGDTDTADNRCALVWRLLVQES